MLNLAIINENRESIKCFLPCLEKDKNDYYELISREMLPSNEAKKIKERLNRIIKKINKLGFYCAEIN